MKFRTAKDRDIDFILNHDAHISEKELRSCISLRRALVAERDHTLTGALRWNLFWDNTPFLNMIFLCKDDQNKGYGKNFLHFWENLMLENQYKLVMTSTLSNENAQHFYRSCGYKDAGSLLLKDEPLEIIFTKELGKPD